MESKTMVKIKCCWKDYYDYRIMTNDGSGHVRVSFIGDKAYISDLYVVESRRRQGIATKLLDEVDKLLEGRLAIVYTDIEWCKEWYSKRGYLSLLKQQKDDKKSSD